MKKSIIFFSVLMLLVVCTLFASNFNIKNSPYTAVTSEILVNQDAHENYNKIMDVLTSPRCINCHPNDNIPKQGDDSHPHYFGMKGGKNDHGFEATKCATCHQSENNDFSGVPGAPEWALAPERMKWEGLTRREIAESILDPKRNGERNLQETLKHLTEHELVLWAWEPGIRADGTPRTLPPVNLEDYKKAVKAWIDNGALIPED